MRWGGGANKAGGYGPKDDIFAGIKDLALGLLLFDLSKDITESRNLAAVNPRNHGAYHGSRKARKGRQGRNSNLEISRHCPRTTAVKIMTPWERFR
jgi:hypothetical protein